MTTSIAGADFVLHPGEVTDRFDDATARRLMARGYAVPVVKDRTERAVKREVVESR